MGRGPRSRFQPAPGGRNPHHQQHPPHPPANTLLAGIQCGYFGFFFYQSGKEEVFFKNYFIYLCGGGAVFLGDILCGYFGFFFLSKRKGRGFLRMMVLFFLFFIYLFFYFCVYVELKFSI